MYSLEYQIERAFAIAAQNPEASIGVFCSWVHAYPIIESLQPDGQVKWQSRTVVMSSGATVRFYQLLGFDDTRDKICGTVFSHVFTRDISDYIVQTFIRSRLRSNGDFIEPMGYYDEFGVHRYEDY